ncbi:hypothetical protein VTH06DRAFT_7894 [Thermothelomyces fergusii]
MVAAESRCLDTDPASQLLALFAGSPEQGEGKEKGGDQER